MSGSEEKARLAGHPPAVKVGGMRVGQHHVHHSEQKPSERAKEEEEFQTEKPETVDVAAGGAIAKGDKDFPPKAASAAHHKPMPTHDNRPIAKGSRGPDMHIGQPKKFNN